MQTYDFGNGLVPAHQHLNPDGTLGGWVADTAEVAETAFVGLDACVFGAAQVLENAFLANKARVSGNAVISGDVVIADETKISENAKIGGNVLVEGTIRIFGSVDISGDLNIFGGTQIWGTGKISNVVVEGDPTLPVKRYINQDGSLGGFIDIEVSTGTELSISEAVQITGELRVFGNTFNHGLIAERHMED